MSVIKLEDYWLRLTVGRWYVYTPEFRRYIGSGNTEEEARRVVEAARANPPAPRPWEPPAGGTTEEETEDMAKRAVGKTGKEARAKGRKTTASRPRVTGNGPAPGTIKALTDEFNALVPKAQKKGIKWAKHHSSAFASAAGAQKQIDRLRAELEA